MKLDGANSKIIKMDNSRWSILDAPSAVLTDSGSSYSTNTDTDQNSQETLSGAEPVTSAELNVMLNHLRYRGISTN